MLTCWLLLPFICSGCAPLAIDLDNAQQWQDISVPLTTAAVEQSFVCHRPGLSAIEIKLASGGDQTLARDASLVLTLYDAEASLAIVEIAHPLSGRRADEIMHFGFPARSESAGRKYRFAIHVTADTGAAIWASSQEAYSEGGARWDGNEQNGDLFFRTYCTYDLQAALADITHMLANRWWALAIAAMLLFAPGWLLLSSTKSGSSPWPSSLGAALSVTLAVLPLLLLWGSFLGLRITPHFARALAALLAILTLCHLLRKLRSQPPSIQAIGRSLHHLPLLLICLLALALRYIQVRGIALPLWTDSVHHTLIVRLIAETGQVPNSYRPFLPIESFIQHFGFHTLSAWFHWLTSTPIPQSVLAIGQMLNALACLPTAELAIRLTRRPLAGPVSAIVVAFVSIMPAYYVSWGRYTQLAGMVILPGAILLTLHMLEQRTVTWGQLAATACTVAGLFLTHYRVAFFYACFCTIYLLYSSLAKGSLRTAATRMASVVLLAAALTLPWLIRLAQKAGMPLSMLPVRGASDGYNAIPWDLLYAGQGKLLVRLSLIAVAWAGAKAVISSLGKAVFWVRTHPFSFKPFLRCIATHWRLHLREEPAFSITLWVGLIAFLVNLHVIGLPDIGVVNNASVVIALFLPFALLIGGLISDWLHMLVTLLTPRARQVAELVLGLALLLPALRYARDMISIINPDTIIATADDVQAISWIREHTDPKAKFLINARHWQRDIYVGSDGGWWIPILADRATSLPPAVYKEGSPQYIAEVNELAKWASEVTALDTPESLERLRRERISHIYIGAKGGHITPKLLENAPSFALVYARGPVRIYELQAP